jgi:hypothetical protein
MPCVPGLRARFVFLGALCALPSALALPEWTGDPALGAQELEHQWQEIAYPRPGTGIRGVFRFALEASALQWHPERVATALTLARSMQDLDPASKSYGNFHWRHDHAKVFDQNAVDFSMQLAGLLRIKYYDRLSPQALQTVDGIMTTAVEGLHRHQVKLSYTNIYLMQAWDLISVGESIKDSAVAEEGYRNFKAWMRYTAGNGITEYGGVTYYGTDLDSLGLINRFAGRPEARIIAGKALNYFWTDLAANWWAPGDRLASANSRSYDYLFGRRYLEAHTWEAGWLREKPTLENAGWLGGQHDNLVAFRRDTTWVPPAEVTAKIRARIPRTIVQRWSGAPLEQRATAYIGSHVTLATSGNTHGEDERTLVVNLGDSPALAQTMMFMDGRGDPYGTVKTENAANQAKSLHLTPFICAVQRGPEALQLLSIRPTGAKAARLTGLYTQVTLTARGRLYLTDRELAPGTPEHPAIVPAGQPIFCVVGDAALGIRFLYTENAAGLAAPVHYIADAAGLPARRLTIVHSAAAPHGRGTVVAWFRVADGLDAGRLAQFRRDFARAKAKVSRNGDELRVDAAGTESHLGIVARLEAEDRRELAGQEPDGLLAVNGYDAGQEILEEFGAR